MLQVTLRYIYNINKNYYLIYTIWKLLLSHIIFFLIALKYISKFLYRMKSVNL